MADEQYRSSQIEVDFDSSRCIHSRTCVLARPHVFVPNADGPWIHPDAVPVDAIVEIAHGCPSGAIQYKRLDGGPSEEAPVVGLIRVRENGAMEIVSGTGRTIDRKIDRPSLSLWRIEQQAVLRRHARQDRLLGSVSNGAPL
jgi:uncharacterized Fe-S cluster protein YjdI